MSPHTPPKHSLAIRCPVTAELHTDIKDKHPKWVMCPDCELPLPANVPANIPVVVDLVTPPPTTIYILEQDTWAWYYGCSCSAAGSLCSASARYIPHHGKDTSDRALTQPVQCFLLRCDEEKLH